MIFAYAGDLPQISALDDYAPSTISRVYGSHGEIVGEFAIQRREIIPYEAISPKLKQAILAAEDSEFEQHFGLSMPHIVMAATRDILGAIRDKITGRRSRPKGASTITQQLARRLFPEAVGFQIGDVSLERKIKEALVAMQIEKRYTKSEIFTLYANQMYLGEGAYGVEAASRTYFGKSAKDLTLDEAATHRRHLPGHVAQCADREHGPREAAPRLRARSNGRGTLHHPQGSRRRQGAADRAGGGAGDPATRLRAYFVEEVRKDLESRYGAKQLYENGLSVQTALDVRLQEAASARPGRGSTTRRQTSRVPEAAPQHHRRRQIHRCVLESPLGSPDGCWQHRAGGRQRD